MLELLFTLAVNTVRGTARLFNYELKIVLSENKIKLKFDSPKREDLAWDDTHWVYGNIFVEGIANPVKIKKSELEEQDIDVITSDRYQTFMEQSLIEDMIQASKDAGFTLKQVVIILSAINMLMVGLVYFFTNGGL